MPLNTLYVLRSTKTTHPLRTALGVTTYLRKKVAHHNRQLRDYFPVPLSTHKALDWVPYFALTGLPDPSLFKTLLYRMHCGVKNVPRSLLHDKEEKRRLQYRMACLAQLLSKPEDWCKNTKWLEEIKESTELTVHWDERALEDRFWAEEIGAPWPVGMNHVRLDWNRMEDEIIKMREKMGVIDPVKLSNTKQKKLQWWKKMDERKSQRLQQ